MGTVIPTPSLRITSRFISVSSYLRHTKVNVFQLFVRLDSLENKSLCLYTLLFFWFFVVFIDSNSVYE